MGKQRMDLIELRSTIKKEGKRQQDLEQCKAGMVIESRTFDENGVQQMEGKWRDGGAGRNYEAEASLSTIRFATSGH
jgi:hypothetical protein